MLKRVFYGLKPKLNNSYLSNFSHGNYECKALLQTKVGDAVVISKCKDREAPIWKVEYGFSCIFFGTYDEAMAYCKGRFRSLED